jgi:hypothetical protein
VIGLRICMYMKLFRSYVYICVCACVSCTVEQRSVTKSSAHTYTHPYNYSCISACLSYFWMNLSRRGTGYSKCVMCYALRLILCSGSMYIFCYMSTEGERERIIFITHLKPITAKAAITDDLVYTHTLCK